MSDGNGLGGWDHLASVDPEQGPVLVERLRLVADSLNAEFGGLSRADAEGLVFSAAQEVLSAASVVHFVPTFAERRARFLLHNGRQTSTPDTGTPAPAPEPAPEPAAEVSSPPLTDPTAPPGPTQFAAVPPWPDAFYTNEPKRLLDRARSLHAGALEAVRANGGT